MKTKLLKKLRKRYYWEYATNRGTVFILEKETFYENWILNVDGNVGTTLGWMLIEFPSLHAKYRLKKRKRKYKHLNI